MSTRHLRNLGNSIAVPIKPDPDGYLGRECPNKDCLGYFKITPGTGLADIEHCVCPYCGTKESHDHFWTQDQLEYAQSIAFGKVAEAVHNDLKSMEFEIKPPRNALFGIGMSMKVSPFQPPPVHRYREKRLETEVVCNRCTLRYAIYGVFGYCPDCGIHNSLGILEANFDLVGKMLAIAQEQVDPALGIKLVENALEDCVSSFDGWGRATVSAFAAKASDPKKAATISFQDIRGGATRLAACFAFDLVGAVSPEDFARLYQVFQKRHLIAHKMGVIDDAYVKNTGDPSAIVGRKVTIDQDEIRTACGLLLRMARGLLAHLEGLP